MAGLKAAYSAEEQDALLELSKQNCKVGGNSSSNSWCSEWWDGIMCWPASPPGLAVQPCPTYIGGFRPELNATKLCFDQGTWMNWTNFGDCYEPESIILVKLEVNSTSLWETYIPLVKTLSHVGYGVSEVTLVIAFIILAAFKRLRCPRNMLHLHLFVSFIMRAFMGFLKASLFEQGIGPKSDFLVRNGSSYFHEEQGNLECKALTILWQYFIAANYSWVLMEGLYIHNVIMWALSADSSSILLYILLGWGLPLIFVPSWAVARAFLDDDLCWTVNNMKGINYIIQIPTTISILINFGLFVNILRLLMSKVRTSIQEEAQRYWRLAKSTLVLVALFGVPYFIFLSLYFGNEEVHLAWLFCDQLFASFQGFFISLLYCYLNNEVQEELKKRWVKLMYSGRVMENSFPTTSFASWSSSLSMAHGACSFTRLRHFYRRHFTCRHRPESRASKRTETVDCIVCENCPPHPDENNTDKHCKHDDEVEAGVEMKLMGETNN